MVTSRNGPMPGVKIGRAALPQVHRHAGGLGAARAAAASMSGSGSIAVTAMPSLAKPIASIPVPVPRSSTASPGASPASVAHPRDQPLGIGQPVAVIKGHRALETAGLMAASSIAEPFGLCFVHHGLILVQRHFYERIQRPMANIALVDDDKNILASVSMLLEQEGYHVRTFSDGAAALTALTTTPPDLAILDIKMPRMDGLELLRRLRQANPTCR